MSTFFYGQFELLQSYLAAGGIIMLPLLAASVVMWILIVDRFFFFRRMYGKPLSRTAAAQYILEGKAPRPEDYRGAVALLVTEFHGRRTGVAALDRPLLEEIVMSIFSRLDRRLSVIGAIAKASPPAGAFGNGHRHDRHLRHHFDLRHR